MIAAGNTLFLGGVPDVPGGEEFYAELDGKAVLWAVATEDGQKQAELQLDAPPVPDGMAAAAGRLFVCKTDGHVSCFGSSMAAPRNERQ
jgi:hypothetical protein